MKHLKLFSLLVTIIFFVSCEKENVESQKDTLIKAVIVFDKTFNDINSNSQRIIRNYNNDFFLYGLHHIIKVENNGNRKWMKEITHKDIAPTKDGGCIVISEEYISQWSSNTVKKMAKLDSEGNLLWEKNGDNYAISKIIAGDNDEIYGIGDNEFPVSMYTKVRKPQLFKYNKDGDFSSSKWLNLPKEVTFGQTICLLKLTNNKIVLGAFFNSSPETASIDYGIVEFDTDGNNVLTKSYGGFRDDNIKNISETPDGGLLLMGYSNSKDGDIKSYKNEFTLNSSNGWVIKLNKNREIEWEKMMGSSNDVTYFYDAIFYNDKYLVGFNTGGTDVDFIGNERPKSGHIIFDKQGNMINIQYIAAWSVDCVFNSQGEQIILSGVSDEYYGTHKPRIIKIK